jgi:hypothetical protein
MLKEIHRDKPYYPLNPIASLESLAAALDIPLISLRDLAKTADNNYHEFELVVTKKDGTEKIRLIKDPKLPLKKIQKRINSRILSKVKFPPYLHGGIKDKDNPRDYFTNASSHTNSHIIISVDVKNFYPSITRDKVLEIFKNFFKFSQNVAEILTDLVTFEDTLPQGAATSSYLANLIFHDKEYTLVNTFRKKSFTYTRLLDDITVSSSRNLSDTKKTDIIKDISRMISGKNLKINDKKTDITSRDDHNRTMKVTGLLVNSFNPRCLKSDKKNIRAAVKNCEIEFLNSSSSPKYHKLWNETSGKVAKLQRVGHSQEKALRLRLSTIFPTISEERSQQLQREVSYLEKEKLEKRSRIGFLKRINNAIYICGVLSRKNKVLAKSLRDRLVILKPSETYTDFWEK